MNHTADQIRKWIRRGLAGTLFTFLLLGASVAALSAFAAGINALSGVQRIHVVSEASPPTKTANPAGQQVQAQNLKSVSDAGAGQSPSDVHATQSSGQSNNNPDHSGSPIGHELDAGGVALGETVQHSFGTMLSGLVQTLLLGQPGPAQSGGQ